MLDNNVLQLQITLAKALRELEVSPCAEVPEIQHILTTLRQVYSVVSSIQSHGAGHEVPDKYAKKEEIEGQISGSLLTGEHAVFLLNKSGDRCLVLVLVSGLRDDLWAPMSTAPVDQYDWLTRLRDDREIVALLKREGGAPSIMLRWATPITPGEVLSEFGPVAHARARKDRKAVCLEVLVEVQDKP